MATVPKRPLTEEEIADAQRLRLAWEAYKSQPANKGATQTWLGRVAGVGKQSVISQYLNAEIQLNLKVLLAICQVIGADPAVISPTLSKTIPKEPTGGKFDQNVRATSFDIHPIPVISYIQAGRLKEISDPYPPGAGFAVEYTGDDVSRWTFALEIEGESMLPDFKEGDRVIIDPELAPNPGDFVVAKNSNEEATFKRYKLRGRDQSGNDVFDLEPLNPVYPTLRSDIEHLEIIGVMVERRQRFRRPTQPSPRLAHKASQGTEGRSPEAKTRKPDATDEYSLKDPDESQIDDTENVG
jgi:SOS-response transcriptional repressor LexA